MPISRWGPNSFVYACVLGAALLCVGTSHESFAKESPAHQEIPFSLSLDNDFHDGKSTVQEIENLHTSSDWLRYRRGLYRVRDRQSGDAMIQQTAIGAARSLYDSSRGKRRFRQGLRLVELILKSARESYDKESLKHEGKLERWTQSFRGEPPKPVHTVSQRKLKRAQKILRSLRRTFPKLADRPRWKYLYATTELSIGPRSEGDTLQIARTYLSEKRQRQGACLRVAHAACRPLSPHG